MPVHLLWCLHSSTVLSYLQSCSSVTQQFAVSQSNRNIINMISVISSILYNLFRLFPIGCYSQCQFCVLKVEHNLYQSHQWDVHPNLSFSLRCTAHQCSWWLHPLLLFSTDCTDTEDTTSFSWYITRVCQHTLQYEQETTAWPSTPLLVLVCWLSSKIMASSFANEAFRLHLHMARSLLVLIHQSMSVGRALQGSLWPDVYLPVIMKMDSNMSGFRKNAMTVIIVSFTTALH